MPTEGFQIAPLSSWLPAKNAPLVIAGPCSAESREQFLTTATQLAANPRIDALRGGVWKPRTRPGSFEGIGTPALDWLVEAKQLTGLPVATEVANKHHVEAALKAGIDILWIGARTTVNPFYVQEIADALQGVDVPVLVKNPIHPDLGLWLGALERLNAAGIQKLAAIHRGFFAYETGPFRNEPKWELTFELRTRLPNLPILCDPSHIAGRRDLIAEVSQTALDINMDGLMIESHCNPDAALSDAKQQITPQTLGQILDNLVVKTPHLQNIEAFQSLQAIREKIDQLDNEMIATLARRFALVNEIGILKDRENISIFQLERFFGLMESRQEAGKNQGLDAALLRELFQVIHKFSVKTQVEASGDLNS
jgi:chorismate mutase